MALKLRPNLLRRIEINPCGLNRVRGATAQNREQFSSPRNGEEFGIKKKDAPKRSALIVRTKTVPLSGQILATQTVKKANRNPNTEHRVV